MGAPAGLKLNSVLSHSLGKFFLYHIHLWRTFLHVITPYVSHFLHLGLEWRWSSAVGFCIQLSFAQGNIHDLSHTFFSNIGLAIGSIKTIFNNLCFRCIQCDNLSCSLFLRLCSKNICKSEFSFDEFMETLSWKKV